MTVTETIRHDRIDIMDLFPILVSPDDVASFQKEVSQSYKTGVYKDCEFRLMRYDGVYRWHLSRAVPVLNHNGDILKWVGVTIDIGNDLFDTYLPYEIEIANLLITLASLQYLSR